MDAVCTHVAVDFAFHAKNFVYLHVSFPYTKAFSLPKISVASAFVSGEKASEQTRILPCTMLIRACVKQQQHTAECLAKQHKDQQKYFRQQKKRTQK